MVEKLNNTKKSNSRSFFKDVVPFFKPYKPTVALALLALLCAAVVSLSLPVIVKKLIDDGFFITNSTFIGQYFLLLFAFFSALAIFASARFYLVVWLGERVIADIRKAVYQHMLSMSPAFFETTRTGEVLSRLTADTTLVQSVVGVGLSISLRSFIMLVGGVTMMTLTSTPLTVIILLVVPLILFPVRFFGRKVRLLSRQSQDKIAESSAIASEVMNAMPMIQSFTLEKVLFSNYQQVIEESFNAARVRNLSRAALIAFTMIIVCSAILFVLWYGTELVVLKQLSPGQLGQFLLYALMVAASTSSLSEMWGDLQKAAGAMERLMELLRAQSEITTPESPVSLHSVPEATIRFENVWFSYPSRPQQWALHNFDLKVKEGETVALVGTSGAGKSTVLQLLLRFYSPQKGFIRVSGEDITTVDPFEVRQFIGIVPQDTVLFATNALENIRLGKPEATDEEVYTAAKAAFADEFIRQQPEGYQTFLGEKGIRLSGGQQQRIAIARAILKNSPIMLLDEATSSLDLESEQKVQEALEHLMANRTTIIIAHRLSTILKADRIVVMDQGRIVATGSHLDLVQQGGLYSRLAELQFGQHVPLNNAMN